MFQSSSKMEIAPYTSRSKLGAKVRSLDVAVGNMLMAKGNDVQRLDGARVWLGYLSSQETASSKIKSLGKIGCMK